MFAESKVEGTLLTAPFDVCFIFCYRRSLSILKTSFNLSSLLYIHRQTHECHMYRQTASQPGMSYTEQGGSRRRANELKP